MQPDSLDVRDQARIAASQLVARSGAYTPPCTFVDLVRLAAFLGVDVQCPTDLGGASGGVMSETVGKDGRAKLVVSVAETGYRGRFTLAHELGHAAVRISSPGIGLSPDREERFVDAFASHVLLPGSLLSLLLNGIEVLTIDDMLKLSRKAKVSLSALVSRISSATDVLWKPRNFILVSKRGLSRMKRENFAPRIVAVSGPKRFYLPTNKRLSKCGLDYLEARFEASPLFQKSSVESTLTVYDRDAKAVRALALLFEYIFYSTADGSRLLVVASEPVDILD